ncbi:MAG: iduronate-2-sulfatase, partial [bacterium]|nr:iduronate-2-sulfatase [bacterium]
LHEESAKVPLIISAPGKEPAVCNSFVELIDLYPSLASMCGLEAQSRLQGLDISPLLDDAKATVRDTAFCVNGRGFLLRNDRWAFISYGEKGQKGNELFDMKIDPKQITNLATLPKYASVVAAFKQQLAEKLAEVRDNDLKD